MTISDTIRIVKDAKYGTKNADEVGGWDGMGKFEYFFFLHFIQIQQISIKLATLCIVIDFLFHFPFRFRLLDSPLGPIV